MQFSALSGVRPMIEKYPLEKAGRSLRSDDQRPRPLSRGTDHGRIAPNVFSHFVRAEDVSTSGDSPRRPVNQFLLRHRDRAIAGQRFPVKTPPFSVMLVSARSFPRKMVLSRS